MSKGLFVFCISATVAMIIFAAAMGLGLRFPFQSTDTVLQETTFTAEELEKIIIDWPEAMAAVDEALAEYRATGGGNRSGEAAIRRGVQSNVFSRQGWRDGRAEYLTSYLYMLRNALLKNSEQHRALGYFMEHYQRNEAVSSELKAWQIEQITVLLEQINTAPDLNAFPPGDVALMSQYFDQFHSMLVNYGRAPNLAQR